MADRRCPYCGAPAEAGHTGCAGLFREVMTTHPASPPEELPAEVAPHAADPARVVRQYVLVEHAGRGGMGVVWKAWDRRLARWVAVKFLHGPLAGDAARFEREARLAAKLHHPNIASVIELGEIPSDKPGEPPVRFLALAFVDGPPLSSASLSPLDAAAVLAKIARAVDAAHRAGILHRDLKPQNILLTREGWPYVTDFGLARTIDGPGSLTSSGSVLGTPAFMAPEQAGGRQADIRSDIYSLGATLYAVLCGRPPFEAESVLAMLSLVQNAEPETPRRLRPEIPPALEAVVLRAMRKAPEGRYASAGALADDLDRVLAGRPLERHPRNVPVVALGLVLLAGIGVAAWSFRPPEAPPAPPPPAPLLKPAAALPPPPDPRARAELLLSRADRVSREERERDRKEIDVLRAASPEIGAYPLDPPELDRIDLAACPRAADPEMEFERVESRLLALWKAGRLTRDARRTLLSLLIAAGAQRRLLAGRSEAEAVADLAAHGPPLRDAGGPLAPVAYGPRVARIFEGELAR